MSSSKEEFLKNHSRDSGVLKTKNCKDHFQSICGSDRNKTASPTLAKPFCANHIESGIKLTLVNCKKKINFSKSRYFKYKYYKNHSKTQLLKYSF